jgi:hypothetical protein
VTAANRISELLALFASRREALLSDLEALVVRESPSDDAGRVTAVSR